MLIIDSLLKFNFFLSRRGAQNPLSFFVQATAANLLVSSNGAELGPVIGLTRAKHGEQSVQEFTHDGYDRLETCFAATEQTLIESPQMRLVAHGHQRRHV